MPLPCLLGCAAFAEEPRHRLALGLFSFCCFFLSHTQKMQAHPLVRASTKLTRFGAKCRHIPPSASLQSSLHTKASRGQSSDEQGSRQISGAGMLWHGCCGLRTLLVRGRVMLGLLNLGKCRFFWLLNKTSFNY